MYDEFGSILLLVMAFKYRYDLSQYDLGVTASSSFVLKLFERGSTSMKLTGLDAKQNKSVGDWISALFMSEGISEETWSSCSPQEFYLLVATLFSQTLGACEMGMLELDTMKGGFECEFRRCLGIAVETDRDRFTSTILVAVVGLCTQMAGKLHLGVIGSRSLTSSEGAPCSCQT